MVFEREKVSNSTISIGIRHREELTIYPARYVLIVLGTFFATTINGQRSSKRMVIPNWSAFLMKQKAMIQVKKFWQETFKPRKRERVC